MAVKITYFVHGTTTDNEQDLATGWSPGELSELGIKQAKELDVLLKGKTWKQAFNEDWRKKKAWQPGWDYTIK